MEEIESGKVWIRRGRKVARVARMTRVESGGWRDGGRSINESISGNEESVEWRVVSKWG